MNEAMITIRDLHKRFRGTEALCGVNHEVPAGRVTALLGPNGAGKTTTIRCAMNLLEQDRGAIKVLGVEPRRLGRDHWRQIGYVSENQRLPGWMTVSQLLDYLRPMYGAAWDRGFERKLLADFSLPANTRLQSLSRGERMKAALVSSLAYRPRLVVLDEPFTGLDPLVREEFLTGMLELTGIEGWTVWLSSHDIEEVERLADRVAVLDRGRVRLEDDTDVIRARFRAIELVCTDETGVPSALPEGWLDLRVSGRSVRFTDSNFDEQRNRDACRHLFPAMSGREARPMNLREIFVALARDGRADGKEVA